MKKILACVAALATGCIMALTGCAARAHDVTVTFYDMGKADAALITAEDGSRILIDAGTNKGGKKLASDWYGSSSEAAVDNPGPQDYFRYLMNMGTPSVSADGKDGAWFYARSVLAF